MKKWGKKKISILVGVCILMYFIIGAMGPFFIPKKVSEEYINNF